MYLGTQLPTFIQYWLILAHLGLLTQKIYTALNTNNKVQY